jgi:hypothetical protein
MRVLRFLLNTARSNFTLVSELGIAPAMSHTIQVSPAAMLWIYTPAK